MKNQAAFAVAALLVSTVASAADFEAISLRFSRPDGRYAGTEVADTVLSYRVTGRTATLTDVRVELTVDPDSDDPKVATFRLREVKVPTTDREFTMPLDLSKLGLAEGTHEVSARLDSADAYGEPDERNNVAWANLNVRRSGSSTTTPPPRASQLMETAPLSSRTISRTTCSALEREWTSPLEVGYHPGFGWASASMVFDHPITRIASGERVDSAVLILRATASGRPFEDAGPLVASVRALPRTGPACSGVSARDIAVQSFDRESRIDITRALDGAPTRECAVRLEVTLAARERTGIEGAHLLRIDAARTMLEVEGTR